jgi:hypothetical protein
MESIIVRIFAGLPSKKRSTSQYRGEKKCGNLAFVYNENNIVSVYSFETISYINLAFFKGTLLPDPKRLLEGTGKGMRLDVFGKRY